MACLIDAPADPEIVLLAERRQPPPMVIVDRNGRVIAQSFDADISEVTGHLRRLVERHLDERRPAARMTVQLLDATTALRIVDLAGETCEYFAITFERNQRRRDAIEAVASEYRLTNREREVFRMLLAGSTDQEVSQRLTIARTTASDHAKNILRKTGANKRTELFARVIAYDDRRVTS
jgi:DNA-binding NarL/FixJ family response regulator